VLRNGCKVDTRPARTTGIAEIVRLMVGKEMGTEFPFRVDVKRGGEALRVEELRPQGAVHAVSFALCRGEIVGVAGLVGSGRTEVVRALFGADRHSSGRIFRDGREVHIAHPRDVVRAGICLLTEDRKAQGLILGMPCYANITIIDLRRIACAGLLQEAEERSAAERLVNELDIKTSTLDQLVMNLSGGNQQKVVIAKWLFREAQVLVFDEPTPGIDVGARQEIYELLWRLAAGGRRQGDPDRVLRSAGTDGAVPSHPGHLQSPHHR
jgi:ribose transport system ATP-binding protein